MLYTELYYIDNNINEMPQDGFKIDEDGIIYYINRKGLERKIKVIEQADGLLEVILLNGDNIIINSFNLIHKKDFCNKCKCDTIHGINISNKKLYCCECVM